MKKTFKINYVLDNGYMLRHDTAFVIAEDKSESIDILTKRINKLSSEHCVREIFKIEEHHPVSVFSELYGSI